jgi:hypothetical protein
MRFVEIHQDRLNFNDTNSFKKLRLCLSRIIKRISKIKTGTDSKEALSEV